MMILYITRTPRFTFFLRSLRVPYLASRHRISTALSSLFIAPDLIKGIISESSAATRPSTLNDLPSSQHYFNSSSMTTSRFRCRAPPSLGNNSVVSSSLPLLRCIVFFISLQCVLQLGQAQPMMGDQSQNNVEQAQILQEDVDPVDDVGNDQQQICLPKINRADNDAIQDTYTIGVLAIRGPEAAFAEFNQTYNDYLTATAGQRFDPPVRFEMKALNFLTLFSDSEASLVDFIYVNPSAYSCIESEYEARSLVSQVSRRKVSGNIYDLKRFGGVIMTRKDRDDISTLADLKGRIIAAASISGLGSGQMQFREMIQGGLDYLNDPKAMVFTSNQGKVVNGVLNGDFDVGFVRTDQMERSKDADGNLIGADKFKVIGPKSDLRIDGVPFPFESSTPLYPEWNLAALSHVPDIISAQVQEAMLNIDLHAAYNSTNSDPLEAIRCDSTDEVSAIAKGAMDAGKFAAWTVTQSYMSLRNMQEQTGFIVKDEANTWRCVRSAELYDSIVCPEGQLKKSKEEVDTGCVDRNVECQEGYQCVCSPCYEPVNCIGSVKIGDSCVEYKVLLPSIIVPIAVICLAIGLWFYHHKNQQMINQAKTAAKNERDLNEFIAHEVRNPLSAALSATVFVKTAVQGEITEDTRDALHEDVGIISSSLRFINDLLRSILDVHRATRDQMVLEQEDVDVQYDIFEPVCSMIYNRDTSWTILVKCPEGLVIKADKLRLQQIVLNLARNSAKFVHEGYVRLRADIVDGKVHLYVEDSGPGIPKEKQQNLFRRYQTSLDSLAQGTGVGLNLVSKLITLMDGTITLDPEFRSGFKDYPGTCIDINLNMEPVGVAYDEASTSAGGLSIVEWDASKTALARIKSSMSDCGSIANTRVYDERDGGLPLNLSVLFVDDDRNLRKLAMRALRRVCPHWYIREAASGETAISLCESEYFDIIFMDQYMTSIEQVLKGTETTRALRTNGVKSIICGLSANNLKSSFESAGADDFQIKPFPSEHEELYALLKRLLSKGKQSSGGKTDVIMCHQKDDVSRLGTVLDGASAFGGDTSSQVRIKELEPVALERKSSRTQPIFSRAISVLFVDDDRILRRLAVRGLKKVMPNCHTREAGSGEEALELCKTEEFDLVFLDKYMANCSKNEVLTGVESASLLRQQGVKSVICGLSANEAAEEFLSAGSDHFQLKPFPCGERELKALLEDLIKKIKLPHESSSDEECAESVRDSIVDFSVSLAGTALSPMPLEKMDDQDHKTKSEESAVSDIMIEVV